MIPGYERQLIDTSCSFTGDRSEVPWEKIETIHRQEYEKAEGTKPS